MPAVAAGAEMHAAGWNTLGQCGDPETTSGLGALAGAAVQQIAQGYQFTLIIILGRLYHAGSNEYGQRGNGRTDKDPHPDFAEIPLPALAVEVVCGAFFSLVLLENGIVLSWGDNAKKQLGRGGDGSVPLPVEGLGEVRHVYAGHDFAFVLLAGGEVRAWGRNDRGQLCLGRAGAAEGSPQRVAALCGRAAALALSSHAGIALFTDDCAVAWGGLNGRLADDTGGRWSAERCCLPLHLRLSAVRTVGAGDNFLCAHLKDGPLVSWGDSDSGVLGRDGPTHVPTPVPFPGDEPIIDFFCLSFCLFAQGPSGWAACGFGRCGLPFGEPSSVCRLTLIPRPWVPCPRQGGTSPFCAFYVRAASESDGWACAQCTFANTPAAAQCEMCSAPRPAGDSAAPAPGHGALCVGAPSPSPPSPTPSGGAAGAATIAPPIVRHADGTAAGTAAPRTLAEAVARFFSRYSVTRPAKRVEQVDNWVKDILVDCSELPGAGPLEEFLEMYEELRKAVDAKPPSTDAHPVAARAARFWTAGDLPQGGMHGGPSMNATYKGREIEFCTWVGHAVCFGSEELLERVVPYLRTLNLFCVTRRGGHDMAPVWEKLRRNSWRLYRGSGFDAAHRDWYRPGLVFRQLRAVASSLKRDTALDFAMRGFENGEWPVLWVIEIDSEPPHCHHVNHLGPGISFYPTEDEFLFPNASVFTVVRVEWQEERRGDRPSLIVLRAARDNRDHPLDLPVAPRS
eukprot:TRINITY_DN1920_c0_g1_i13.p1 TRINITY_DN1920_c0_g1~~TRINITY_DN1920_c0_g1_i13.p1  ORF type:complete len:735 (+),score=196.70 TRINITY_DN1920_c0_g1_i13:82-2286(+)